MGLVARAAVVLLLLLGLFMIGAAVFSWSHEGVRLVIGLLIAAAAYQLWARGGRTGRDRIQK